MKTKKQMKTENSQYHENYNSILKNEMKELYKIFIDSMGKKEFLYNEKKLHELRNELKHFNLNYENTYKDHINNAMFDAKSSVKLSYGTKKKLDELNKDKKSYEDLILDMIKKLKYYENKIRRYEENIDISNVTFDIQTYKRKKQIFTFSGFRVIYSTNIYEPFDDDFQYKIIIDEIRDGDKKVDKNKFFSLAYTMFCIKHDIDFDIEKSENEGELLIYFLILKELIHKDFNHKISDLYIKKFTSVTYWDYAFTKITLPINIMQHDVYDKLNKYRLKNGQISIKPKNK